MVNQTIIDTVKKYIKTVEDEISIENAYLFGSYAKGSSHKDSDIDIALVLNRIDDIFDLRLKLMKLRRKIDLRIEPHPISKSEFNLENPFAKEVIQAGIAI